jgi:hypothetical protein
MYIYIIISVRIWYFKPHNCEYFNFILADSPMKSILYSRNMYLFFTVNKQLCLDWEVLYFWSYWGKKGGELPLQSYFYEMAPHITSLVFEVFSKFTTCILSETVISEYLTRAIMHKIAWAEGLGENNSLKWEFLILSAEISMSFIVGRLVESNFPVE